MKECPVCDVVEDAAHGCAVCGGQDVHDDAGYVEFACPVHANRLECYSTSDGHKLYRLCNECVARAKHTWISDHLEAARMKAGIAWRRMARAKYYAALAEGRDPSRG